MRSIELVFDAQTEARIRDDWARLAAAGMSSLAAHTASSNRPHLTLAAGAELQPPTRPVPLPGPVAFGGLVLFPHADRVVLAWSVVHTPELDALHRAVHTQAKDALPTSLPGAWTPHVTLARRLRLPQLGEAVALLGEPFAGRAAGIRFWDGETAVPVPSSTGA